MKPHACSTPQRHACERISNHRSLISKCEPRFNTSGLQPAYGFAKKSRHGNRSRWNRSYLLRVPSLNTSMRSATALHSTTSKFSTKNPCALLSRIYPGPLMSANSARQTEHFGTPGLCSFGGSAADSKNTANALREAHIRVEGKGKIWTCSCPESGLSKSRTCSL